MVRTPGPAGQSFRLPAIRFATRGRAAYFSFMSENGELTRDLTRNQNLVLDALSGATGPLSAYGILDRVRGEGIKAPLQIYRALDKLVEMGLAHRLESLNAFVACAHAHAEHEGLAAFAICEGCGRVDEFADPVVEERLAGWSRSTGFRNERTTIEIRGHCRECVAAGRV